MSNRNRDFDDDARSDRGGDQFERRDGGDRREQRQEQRGEQRPSRAERRAAREAAAEGGEEKRTFGREKKLGLTAIGVLGATLVTVSGLRLTGKMPRLWGQADAAAEASASTDKPKKRLASGPVKNDAAKNQPTDATPPASVNGLLAGAANAASSAANAAVSDAGLVANDPNALPAADPFSAATDATRVNVHPRMADADEPAVPPDNMPANNTPADNWNQGQLAGAGQQAASVADAALDQAAGMIDQGRQSLDATTQGLVDQAGQYAPQAQQLVEQAADAFQQQAGQAEQYAQQAVDQARDYAQQGARWMQDQAQSVDDRAVAAGSPQGDWRHAEDAAANQNGAWPAETAPDGSQPWPQTAAAGQQDLSVEAPSEPPLRIPDEARRREEFAGGATRGQQEPYQDQQAPGTASAPQVDQRDPWQNEPAQPGQAWPEDRAAARDANGYAAADPNTPASDRYQVAPSQTPDAWPSDRQSARAREADGYDSSRELFPDEGGSRDERSQPLAADRGNDAMARRGEPAASEQYARQQATGQQNTGQQYAGQQYSVQADDNYWRISQKLYGSGGYFKALYEHNRARHPQSDRLRVGDVIEAPSAEELAQKYPDLVPLGVAGRAQARATAGAARPTGRAADTYVVREGDTLFDIARQELGRAVRWAEIFELNRDVLGDDIDNLRPGMQLRLPTATGPVTARQSYRSRR